MYPSGSSTTVTAIDDTDSPYTVISTDETIAGNATSGAITVNLPLATGSGRMLTIKKVDTSANTITVDGNGSETIDGSETHVLTSYESITIVDNASGTWIII